MEVHQGWASWKEVRAGLMQQHLASMGIASRVEQISAESGSNGLELNLIFFGEEGEKSKNLLKDCFATSV